VQGILKHFGLMKTHVKMGIKNKLHTKKKKKGNEVKEILLTALQKIVNLQMGLDVRLN
jgi:hypothetical protein